MRKNYKFEENRIVISSIPRILPLIILIIVLLLLTACNSQSPKHVTQQHAVVPSPQPAYKSSAHKRLAYAKTTQYHYKLAGRSMSRHDYRPAIKHYSLGLLSLYGYKKECRKDHCSPRAIRLMNRSFAAGYQEMGRAKYLTGRYSSSVTDFKRALKYDPYNARTHYYLGLIFAHRRQYHLVRHEYQILRKQGSPLANRLRKFLYPAHRRTKRARIHRMSY